MHSDPFQGLQVNKGRRWSFPAAREINRQGGGGAGGTTHIFFCEKTRDLFLAQKNADPTASSHWLWTAVEVSVARPYVESNYGAKPGLAVSPFYRVHGQSDGALCVGLVPSPSKGADVRAYTHKSYYDEAMNFLLGNF